MKLVYVEWIDARGVTQEWTEIEEMKAGGIVAIIRSVGWVLQETDDLLQIVPHIANDPEQGCGDMTIPRSQVKRMTALNLPRTKKKGR